MKTDSGLSAYCHGNADFPNVWERCWPTHITKGRLNPESVFMKGYLWSKYGGPPKWDNGKVAKILFTILHFLLQFQPPYLKNRTELRNDILHTDGTPQRPLQRHVKILVHNVVLVKQQVNGLRPYITIGT